MDADPDPADMAGLLARCEEYSVWLRFDKCGSASDLWEIPLVTLVLVVGSIIGGSSRVSLGQIVVACASATVQCAFLSNWSLRVMQDLPYTDWVRVAGGLGFRLTQVILSFAYKYQIKYDEDEEQEPGDWTKPLAKVCYGLVGCAGILATTLFSASMPFLFAYGFPNFFLYLPVIFLLCLPMLAVLLLEEVMSKDAVPFLAVMTSIMSSFLSCFHLAGVPPGRVSQTYRALFEGDLALPQSWFGLVRLRGLQWPSVVFDRFLSYTEAIAMVNAMTLLVLAVDVVFFVVSRVRRSVSDGVPLASL